MSGVSVSLGGATGLSSSRPAGRVLVVGATACRAEPLAILARHALNCDEVDDVYAAMAQLASRPMVYRAVVLSLSSLYRGELAIIPTIKRRYPHIEAWVAQSDGRAAALAESVRLGADALVSGDGIHRIDQQQTHAAKATPRTISLEPPIVRRGGETEPPAMRLADNRIEEKNDMVEPILTAEELRALLSDLPPTPLRQLEEA